MKKSERALAAAAAAAEKARLAELLKQKVDAYVELFEGKHRTINFDLLPADLLLVIQALNDWSAGALGEDGNVRFTFSGTDPTCATEEELVDLLGRLHSNSPILYPVTGFYLSSEDQSLRYRPMEASYRIRPHLDGSRASAVRVAEAKHISDVEAAHQLWVTCATEDCFAYLSQQMSLYSLELDDEDVVSTKRLVASYVQERFSPAQIWNAMWRSVRQAAALSNREYFNRVKAAKTISKNIDKVLNEALEDSSFQAYDRSTSRPIGAVLSLFRQRFGVGDSTPGGKVREVLAADAALAPQSDATDNCAASVSRAEDGVPEQTLARGTLFFRKEFTELDRLALACLEGAQFESEVPTWDESDIVSSIEFTLPDLYAFDGTSFFSGIVEMLDVAEPSVEDVAQIAAELPNDSEAASTAYIWLAKESLCSAGVSEQAATSIAIASRFPIELNELLTMVQGIPQPSGLVALRIDHTILSGSSSCKTACIEAGGYSLAVPKDWLEPHCSDHLIVEALAKCDTDALAGLLAEAIHSGFRSSDAVVHADLLNRLGKKLIALAADGDATGTDHT